MGCFKCASVLRGENRQLNIDIFIEKANNIHNFKYDYSESCYIDAYSKVKIICKKHGPFYQTADSHMNNGNGCPKCTSRVSKPERNWLDSLNIPDTKENRNISIKIDNCNYSLDGYIPETNTVYEFYGDFWHGNPKVYGPNDINTINKKKFGDLYLRTIERENKLKAAGLKVISIWEYDFKRKI